MIGFMDEFLVDNEQTNVILIVMVLVFIWLQTRRSGL